MLRFVVGLVTATALALPAVAAADPAAAQPGTPCGANLADAMTWPSDGTAPLACVGGPSGNQWETVDSPYPVSNRWVSLGPPMKLHGEGLRNAAIKSGDWTATPLDPDGRCGAEQLAVVPGVGTGPPQDVEGEPGQTLSLQVVPQLFSIEMTGPCLWQMVNP